MLYVAHQEAVRLDFGGLGIYDYIPNSTKSASVALVEVPPNCRHALARSRRSDKFYWCLAGPVSFTVEEKNILLKQSDLLVIFKNEWFSYHNDTPEPSRLLLFHVPSFDLGQEEFWSAGSFGSSKG